MGVIKRKEKIPVGASYDEVQGGCKRHKQQKRMKTQSDKIQTAAMVLFT
jgi:hypothetical protein